MAIVYDPNEQLKKIAPEKKLKRVVSRGANFKRAALAFIEAFPFIDKEAVSNIALKTVKSYQDRIEKVDGDKKKKLKSALIASPKLLINRVQNEVLTQISGEIKNKYAGEFYEWLPSDADDPDPLHQLNYGKIFQVGVGEQPGDRFGCKCGMRILVDDEKLNLT